MACTDEEYPTYVYVILVNGDVSRDGFFPEEEVSEARRVAKKYEKNYNVEVKRVKRYSKDLT